MYNNSTRHILFIFIFGNCQLSSVIDIWKKLAEKKLYFCIRIQRQN